MNAPSFSALVWRVVERHKLTADQAAAEIDACSDELAIATADLAKAQHLREREEWLTDSLNGLDDHRTMPWSLKAPCSCVAHRQPGGGWEWKSCSVAMEGMK